MPRIKKLHLDSGNLGKSEYISWTVAMSKLSRFSINSDLSSMTKDKATAHMG